MPTLKIHNAEIGYTQSILQIPNNELIEGKITLLVGDNGVGKTTLLKSILGQIPLRRGKITIDDADLSSLSKKEIASKIAMVFSKAYIPIHYTVFELIALGKFVHYPYYFQLTKNDEKNIFQIIEKLNLQQYTNTPIHQLSDGNLQKAFIGMALAQDTPIILLDEPITHLDQNNKTLILQLLRDISIEYNKTILLSSHSWRLAMQFADFVWIIKNQYLHMGLSEDMQWKWQEIFSDAQPILNGNQFIAPQIIGNNDKIALTLKALKKNFNANLSSLTLIFSDNETIEIRSENQKKYLANTIYQVIEKIKMALNDV